MGRKERRIEEQIKEVERKKALLPPGLFDNAGKPAPEEFYSKSGFDYSVLGPKTEKTKMEKAIEKFESKRKRQLAQFCKFYGEPIGTTIDEICKDRTLVCLYAADVLKGRWPEMEPFILESPYEASQYAETVIGGRWPEAEPVIMEDALEACDYARFVIGGRWPEAESVIARDAEAAYWYALYVIEGRWPEAEKAIAKNAKLARLYAINILKQRWPKAEDIISNDAEEAFYYAGYVINGRWPKAEPVIAKNKEYADAYAEFLFSLCAKPKKDTE